MPQTAKTYLPDNLIHQGELGIWRNMLDRVKDNRWLIWQLFLRDLLAIYKQSFIGVFWIFIMPLMALMAFMALNGAGVLSVGDIKTPYPLYALIGLLFWQIFAAGLAAATNSLTSAGQMIRKISFPMESIVFASMAQALVAFLIQTAAVFALFAYYRVAPTAYMLLIPLAAIPIIALTLGIGFVFSLINGITRDLEKVTGVIVNFLMLITPVMYAKPQQGILGAASAYNPMYYLVDVPRNLILTGTTDQQNGYVLSALAAAAIFLVSWRIFYITQTRITERV